MLGRSWNGRLAAGAIFVLAAAGGLYFHRDRNALPPASASPPHPARIVTTMHALAKPTPRSSIGTAAANGSPGVVAYDRALDPDLDQLSLKDRLPDMLERAKRNPSLAYALAKALLQCGIADASYAALSGGAEAIGGAEQATARMAELDRSFAKCKGMKGKNLELRYQLATMAANGGLLKAQIDYRALASEYVVSEDALRHPEVAQAFHDNVVAFTTRAAASGDPNALFSAFRLYSDGMILPPDSVSAYRYLKAYAQAQPNAGSQNLLASYASHMSPDDLQRATDR